MNPGLAHANSGLASAARSVVGFVVRPQRDYLVWPTARLASKTSTIGDHYETSSIAQKSLANDAPLMGELSALMFDPVTYS